MDDYSGLGARCVKCGSMGAMTRWFPEVPAKYDSKVTPKATPERMDRECGTCGYRWRERPMDQKGEGGGEG